MNDLRIKKIPYEYNGKTYQLCCNFNVLADMQEEFGDEFPDFSQFKTLRFIICSMMNDYADSMGWEETVTPTQVGRCMRATDTKLIADIAELIKEAVFIPTEEIGEEKN